MLTGEWQHLLYWISMPLMSGWLIAPLLKLMTIWDACLILSARNRHDIDVGENGCPVDGDVEFTLTSGWEVQLGEVQPYRVRAACDETRHRVSKGPFAGILIHRSATGAGLVTPVVEMVFDTPYVEPPKKSVSARRMAIQLRRPRWYQRLLPATVVHVNSSMASFTDNVWNFVFSGDTFTSTAPSNTLPRNTILSTTR
jgi:hypothetical protein